MHCIIATPSEQKSTERDTVIVFDNSKTRLAIYIYHDHILLRLDRDNFMQHMLHSNYSEGCPVSSGIIRDSQTINRPCGLSISMCYLHLVLHSTQTPLFNLDSDSLSHDKRDKHAKKLSQEESREGQREAVLTNDDGDGGEC